MYPRTPLVAAALALATVLGACSSGSSSNEAARSTTTTTAGSTAVRSSTKVSANTASQQEIVTALAGAGVPNAQQWAREVVEYRPYPKDDSKLTKLRENLAKYKPDAATVDKIVSALTP